MLDFTFLTKEQCFDENRKLDFFNKRDCIAENTDFTSLLSQNISFPYYSKGNASWWLQTADANQKVPYIVLADGTYKSENMYSRKFGARPAVSYSSIKDIATDKRVTIDRVISVSFGEYPQNLASDFYKEILEQQYEDGSIKETGKKYSIPLPLEDDKDKSFKTKEIPEYEYNGKKFIRFVCKNVKDGFKLRNKEVLKSEHFWIEVAPIRWLVDEEKDVALTYKIIFGGVPFYRVRKYSDDFRNTDIKNFMQRKFLKDIFNSTQSIKTEYIKSNEIKELKKAYSFNFEEVSEEELIKGSLESNIAPFLHGRSSEGKSARIKEFDPDAEIVYLRNATPDSLNGKSVYNAQKNEMIDVPPTWYVKLKEKCEKEPDKLHIVFFDELTNALPSIQGMAFNIILDKEINGKWKLPENARVAAAGNDLEDSLAANTMAEPLFNRFNHVYINTTVDSWLNWALTSNNSYERLDYKKQDTSKQLKIHPAIYAYIACKKNAVLRTKFTGVKPNADPRKWEMASKVLYQTNNPYMLRGLIGEELTNDFVAFCKTKVISINDVIGGNYDEMIFEINSSEKYLTVLSLSNVDKQNLEVVRSFIEKLGEEFLALFDSLWTIGDDERLETLMNLKNQKVKIKNKK